jgi:undecaprenyl-diphosphatase
MPSRALTWIEARINWLRAPELRLLVILGVVALLLLGFLVLGSEVREGDTIGFDRAILLAFRTSPDDPIGPPWFEAAVMNLSALGSAAVTGLVSVIAVLYFAFAGRRRFALLIAGCAIGTEVWMWVFKAFYGRERPSFVRGIDVPTSLSFPSGHSMISAALYLTLAVLISRTTTDGRLRIFVVATGAALALIVGTTRVYLGVHYPTDVVAGWTLGVAWALTCGVIARWLGGKGEVETTGPSSDDHAASADDAAR